MVLISISLKPLTMVVESYTNPQKRRWLESRLVWDFFTQLSDTTSALHFSLDALI